MRTLYGIVLLTPKKKQLATRYASREEAYAVLNAKANPQYYLVVEYISP